MSKLFGPGEARKITITDNEILIATNPFLETSRGELSGYSGVEKFGRNDDVDSGAVEDVWDGGGVWVAPTQARVHNLASTSANDTSAGSGARTVEVFGLDASGLLANETVPLSGTALALTGGTYSMVHRLIVRSAGTLNTNEGTIKATAQTDNTVTAQIQPGNGQTLMADLSNTKRQNWLHYLLVCVDEQKRNHRGRRRSATCQAPWGDFSS
jgi:hypothetical protein